MVVLAFVDTTLLLSSLLTFSLPHFNDYYSMYLWYYLVPYTLPIAQTSLTASVYMTISLTLERYFSVVHPLYKLRIRFICTVNVHGTLYKTLFITILYISQFMSLRSSVFLSLPSLVFAFLFTGTVQSLGPLDLITCTC